MMQSRRDQDFRAAPGEFLEACLRVCGPTLTLKITAHYGGGELYIPAYPSAKNGLVKLIGLDATERLVKHFGVGKVGVPLLSASAANIQRAAKRVLVREAAAEGTSSRALARRLKCSTRSVERMRARMKARGEL